MYWQLTARKVLRMILMWRRKRSRRNWESSGTFTNGLYYIWPSRVRPQPHYTSSSCHEVTEASSVNINAKIYLHHLNSVYQGCLQSCLDFWDHPCGTCIIHCQCVKRPAQFWPQYLQYTSILFVKVRQRLSMLKESKRELLVFAAHWIYWIWGYALQTSFSLDLVLTFPSSDRYN